LLVAADEVIDQTNRGFVDWATDPGDTSDSGTDSGDDTGGDSGDEGQ
jgi:hypothetical protein